MSTVLKKNTSFVWQKIQEEAVLLNVNNGRYYGLNAVGCSFWEKVDGKRTIGDIIDSVMGEFEVDRSTLEADIESLVKELLKHQILEAQC